MNELQTALAFSRAYALFAYYFRDGFNDDLTAVMQSVTGQAVQASSEMAAQHYQLYGHNVFPYEAIFLGTDGLLGGEITEAVLHFHQQVGSAVPENESPDHLSAELELMDFLCGAEMDAIEDNLPHQIQRMRGLQRRFLDEHLLRWLPGFVRAVQQQGQGIHSEIALHTLNLALEHRHALGDDLMQPPQPFTLADVPDLMSSEKTSLRDIASYLLIPAYTGFYLSFDDIRRLGAQFRLPHGFGKRQQILTNLLRTAADYGLFEDVIAALEESAQGWLDFYEGLDLLPGTVRAAWVDRLAQSMEILGEIRQLAAEQRLEPDDLIDAALLEQGQASAGCEVEKDGEDGSAC